MSGMAKLIIRKMQSAHCKRGPAVCEQCREMDVEKPCLLDIDPDDRGLMQRRVIELVLDGEIVWREYDIVRSFTDEQEAREYAAIHQIADIVL